MEEIIIPENTCDKKYSRTIANIIYYFRNKIMYLYIYIYIYIYHKQREAPLIRISRRRPEYIYILQFPGAHVHPIWTYQFHHLFIYTRK